MGLSMYERQVLAGIEQGLRREDPRFAAQLDLLGPTETPPTKIRRPSAGRRGPILAVVGALLVIALFVLLVGALV